MSFLNAQAISSLAVPLLRRSLVLGATVLRNAAGDFDGPNGSTISVRVRIPRTHKEQETPGEQIDFSDLQEISIPVAVSHLYDAAHLTDEDLTLTIENFGVQVLQPMVAAVAEGAEDQIAEVINDLVADDTGDADDIDDAILQIREALSTRKVPAGRRFLACSPDVISAILAVDKFVRVDATGGTSALEQASPGMIYGMRVVESPALDPGTLAGYHESALVWANRAPAPAASVDSATVTDQGVALRTVRAYDVSHLREAVAVSTYAGAALIEDSDESGEDTALRIVKYTINEES